MKKGDVIELQVTDINNLGCGVGRYGGKVVFIKGAVTGDKVTAEVIKDNKSYAVARLVNILFSSPNRVEKDECDAPFSCGGCVYRHISYEHEREIKRRFVQSAFVKAGLSDVAVLPVVGTDKIYGYRNKGQYPVCSTKNGMRTGFYAAKTHSIIPSDGCAIQNPLFEAITRYVCLLCDEYGISSYDENSGKGLLRHIYLRIGEMTGEIMLCLVLNGERLPREEEFAQRITERFPEIVSLLVNENTRNTNVVLGEKYRVLAGRSYIEDELCGLRFRIKAESFYQVNRDGAELLYGIAEKLAELDGTATVADLYCGTGTIGLSIANKVQSLVGIEIVQGAVDCAKMNAKENDIENAKFYCADASDPKVILECMGGKSPDVVIIDPPRKGSTKALVKCLSELCVTKVVYVSCDPVTLARDCVWFREMGYDIGEGQPVDMFPRTGHVECVVCLTSSTNQHVERS